MRKGRFSEEQMVAIIREGDRDPVAAVAKRHGISEQTIYTWRKRFGALQANDVKRLRQLEAENARLKKLVAERDLEIEVMKEVAAKNVWSAPSVQGSWTRHDDSCVNVSGLSRVGCCCSQAMMRSARIVLK
jgi:putative transposase